jgi:hypothetical protein
MKGAARAVPLVMGILPACATLVGADFDDVHLAGGGQSAVDGGGTPGSRVRMDHEAGSAGTPASLGGTGGEPGSSGVTAGGVSGGEPSAGAAGAGGVESLDSGCPSELGFVDVVALPEPDDGGPSAQVLASGVARLDRGVSDERCQAALLGSQFFLTIDCVPDARDTLVFGVSAFPGTGLPGSTLTYQVSDLIDSGERFAIANFDVNPFTWATLRLPLQARDPTAHELLTIITHRGDGFARAARVSLGADLFQNESEPVDAPSDMSSVFNRDGHLIGFCAFDECVRPRDCVSISRVIEASAALRAQYAMRGLFVGDATGDGKADFTAIDAHGVGVMRSDGSSLTPLEWWVPNPYFGTRQNLLADFDGDGLVDLGIVNDIGFAIRRSNGSEYGSQANWFTPRIWGPWGTQAGDVDGQPGADLVMVDVDHLAVRRSTGSNFAAVENWGSIDTKDLVQLELTDLTHDGRADLVEVYADRIEVAASSGKHFDEPLVWLQASTPVGGYFLADVTGDGAADAIQLARGRFQIFVASPSAFHATEQDFQTAPPVGDRANYFADATGDGRADAITLDNDRVLVSPSSGADFLAPQTWLDGPFYGGI